MNDLSNAANFLAFAIGFAMGTYIGLVTEEKLSIGMVILHIIIAEESNEEIISFMRSENYCVTSLDASGSRGDVRMILSHVTGWIYHDH